jgi:uncharacterized Zn finger protein
MRDSPPGQFRKDAMKLTKAQLQRYVDERYIQRGQVYFEQGQVVLDTVTDSRTSAVCTGDRIYKITLELNGQELSGYCTCPAFEDFGPCKHIAATALAVMADKEKQYAANVDTIERVDEHHAVRKRLFALSKSELVDLLMQFSDDEEFSWLLDGE